MGSWKVVAVVALAACNGKDAGTTTDGTSYSFECEVSEPADLGDPFDPIDGEEHACEDAVYYNPDVPTATTYYVGEFHMDDCGTVMGRETWVLYPNDTWAELGGEQCRIVWAVSGLREDRVTIGNYSLNLTMTEIEDESDCDDIPDFQDLYDPTFSVTYDVATAGDASTFYFMSGTVLGTGEANANHVTYTSEVNCKLF